MSNKGFAYYKNQTIKAYPIDFSFLFLFFLISKGNFIQELNNESPKYTGTRKYTTGDQNNQIQRISNL